MIGGVSLRETETSIRTRYGQPDEAHAHRLNPTLLFTLIGNAPDTHSPAKLSEFPPAPL